MINRWLGIRRWAKLAVALCGVFQASLPGVSQLASGWGQTLRSGMKMKPIFSWAFVVCSMPESLRLPEVLEVMHIPVTCPCVSPRQETIFPRQHPAVS